MAITILKYSGHNPSVWYNVKYVKIYYNVALGDWHYNNTMYKMQTQNVRKKFKGTILKRK